MHAILALAALATGATAFANFNIELYKGGCQADNFVKGFTATPKNEDICLPMVDYTPEAINFVRIEGAAEPGECQTYVFTDEACGDSINDGKRVLVPNSNDTCAEAPKTAQFGSIRIACS